LASLKKLAGQTAWYGLSSIFARLLNYLLTPYLTGVLAANQYGDQSIMYSAIPFLNVIFTYGMETAFFRFINKEHDSEKVYNTLALSLIATSGLFAYILIGFNVQIGHLLKLRNPEFITWIAYIVTLDALCTLPFAKLRNDARPKKYAFIRIAGIVVNIALVFFFYSILPGYAKSHPGTFIASWWNPKIGAGYVLIANLVMSGLNVLMLSKEFMAIRLKFDPKLWWMVIIYAFPIMIANFGGIINETFDRIMLDWWGPGSEYEQKARVGTYNACYKLSLLITLFIQAFRMGAEPFFFQQAKETEKDAKKAYARVMKFFVIIICVMFMFVVLYIDIWKHFISNPSMWNGLDVVPILLLANMCLGVYYNLSIWYRLTHKPWQGPTITLIGAALTLLINYIFIPKYSYMASAWATLVCYGSMMIISYIWGQRVYKVPYPMKKIAAYFFVMMFFCVVEYGIRLLTHGASKPYAMGIKLTSSTLFMFLYLALILKIESKELQRLPFVGKYIR
jgi:O-antigen/teichoic acid export membrane protein